jgi:membrane protease YdiL (CAAX protease family)
MAPGAPAAIRSPRASPWVFQGRRGPAALHADILRAKLSVGAPSAQPEPVVAQQPPAPRRYTREGWLLFYYLASSIFMYVTLSLLVPSPSRQDPDPPLPKNLLGFATYLLLIPVLVAAMTRDKLDLRALLGRPSRTEITSAIALGIGLLLLMHAALFFVYFPLSLIAPELSRELLFGREASLEWTFDSPLSASNLLGLPLAWLLAPVAEELMFRGLLLPAWIARWGVWRAVLASSALFAIWHAEPVAPFLLSIAISQAFLATSKLYVPIALHCATNVSASLVSWMLIAWTDPALDPWASFLDQWWLVPVGLAVGLPLALMAWPRLRMASPLNMASSTATPPR